MRTTIPALLLLCRFILSPSFAMMASPSSTYFSRGLVPTPLGHIHYTSVGDHDASNSNNSLNEHPEKIPIVGFHMSPRSVDEYKEIVTACSNSGDGRFFVAVDEFGYGQSDNPSRSCTLDETADCFLTVLDHLGIQKCVVAGSLMGCYMALSLANRHPDVVVLEPPGSSINMLNENAEEWYEKVSAFADQIIS